jgi:Chalcone isomerase like
MPSLVWLGVGSLLLTFPLWFKQPLPTDTTQQRRQQPPVHGSTIPDVTVQLKSVEEPVVPPTEDFPVLLDLEGKTFKLVAWGARTVSFLGIRVYNVGLYIPETEYDVLPTYSLSHTSPKDSFSTLIRIFSYPLLLRIIPTRNTDFAHLRDGFVRSTSQRLKVTPEERERVDDAVRRFKKLFPGGKMKKGEVLTLLQWGPEVRLYVGGKMEEDLGGVKNDEFARGLMSAYLVGENVVSPDLLGKLTVKVKAIAEEAKELVEPIKGTSTKL